jgi:hypothetical protein
LAERQIEHELSLGGRLKPERAKLEVAKFSLINQVDYPAAVKGVPCKSIRMPGDNSICSSGFDPFEHFVEEGAALGHRALGFFETRDDIDSGSADKLANFSQLVADAANLTVFTARRFADINDVAA